MDLRQKETNLKQDIILQLTQKMNHLPTPTSNSPPIPSDHLLHLPKHAPRPRGLPLPGPRNGKLDSLDPPQKVEHLEVLACTVRRDNHVKGRVDFVFQGEDVPAYFAVGEFEHAGVEAAEDFGGVELRV